MYRTLSKTLCRLVKSEQVKSTSFLPEGGVGEHPHNIIQGKKNINMATDYILQIQNDYYKRYERFRDEILKSQRMTFFNKAELLEKMDQDMQEKDCRVKRSRFYLLIYYVRGNPIQKSAKSTYAICCGFLSGKPCILLVRLRLRPFWLSECLPPETPDIGVSHLRKIDFNGGEKL